MIDEMAAIWALSNIWGLGPSGIRRLLERFGSAADVFESFSGEGEGEGDEEISKKLAKQLATPRDWDDVSARMKRTIPDDAKIIGITDKKYPSKLKNISDPPPFFYYKGKLENLEGPSLGIVGSRKPTDYGRRMTNRLSGEIASYGVTIVSGLAFGVDAFAHESALEAGGKTVAVFGSGLDHIYPPNHRALASRIVERGCLISEFPKGTRPERHNFPIRNRIISGLSDGVLVVEAAEKSGALVTARYALEQNRDVLALPGSVDSELSRGSNNLIKQGAIPVTEAADILANFKWHKGLASVQRKVDLSGLSTDEKSLYSLLSIQPIHLDEIGKKLVFGPARMAELLLKLELKGLILRKPGNYVVRN